MRIAYVCADPGVPVFGRKGCSVHVQEVVRAFRGRGARVELFATCRGGEPPPDLRAVPVHPLPAVPKGEIAARERAALALNAEGAAYRGGFPGARGRVHVVPHGVSLDRFPLGQSPSRPARTGVFTVGFVGSLKPWHGLPVLAEAVTLLRRRDRDVRLLVVGDG